jgi:hypothetical protein
VIPQNQSVRSAGQIDANSYPESAEIATAVRVYAARLEQRLALARIPTSFECFATGSGDSEHDEGHSKEDCGFEELHGCGSEIVGVK